MTLRRRRPATRRCVVFVGHFTPPVHGMAAAMDTFTVLTAKLGPVRQLRTVPRRGDPGFLHHAKRAWLTTRAAIAMAVLRVRSDAVVMSVDAGMGMVFVISLTWMARLLRYRVVLQHHSKAYVSRRSRLAAMLVRAAGARAIHLYSCQAICEDFQRLYPRAARVTALSVAYAVEVPKHDRAPSQAFTSRPPRVRSSRQSNVGKRSRRSGQVWPHCSSKQLG